MKEVLTTDDRELQVTYDILQLAVLSIMGNVVSLKIDIAVKEVAPF